MAEFTVGDSVELKSGSPEMTVESVDHDSVTCIWFDKNQTRQRDTFMKDTIQIYQKKGGTTYLQM